MANKRKIFDITPPPEKITEVKKPLTKELLPKKPLSLRVPERSEGWRRTNVLRLSFRFKKPILITVGVLLVGVLCFVFIKPQAEIEIWPMKEAVKFTTQFSSVGEVIKQERALSQEFPATGKAVKEEKAQGVIRVYNNYQLDQILVQNTRFWCFVNEELREFKTKEKIVIAPQKHLDVQVIASAAGEEYNIGPCTFSVPGLKGSPRYTAVYGESFSPMTGGKKIEVTQVTQEDLDKAEAVLKQKALKECQTSLENSVSPEQYLMIEEAMKTEITEATPLTEKGKAVDNFIFQVKAKGSLLALKKSDLRDFAKDYVFSQIPQEKELVESSLGIGYLPETVDFKEAEVTLDIEISAEIYSAIDEASLKERVKNKRPDEISRVFRDFPEGEGINESQIRLWPFWVTTAPEDTARIKINVILD